MLTVYLCPSEPRTSLRNQAPGDPFPSADADYGGMFGPRGLGNPAFTNNPPAGAMVFNQNYGLAQITDGLLRAGLSEIEIRKVMGENVLRVLRQEMR